MKNKAIFIFILLIISQLAIISCSSLVTEIDPSILPHTDSKLVVACFISPQDTILSAKVTQTKTVIGSTSSIKDDITNATVKLSDGTKTISLIYNATDGYYRALPADLPIVAGKTYSIAVSSTDGRKVDATATVPPNVPIKELKVDSAQTTSNRRNNGNQMVTEYTVKIIWQDAANVANFYRGIGIFEEIYKGTDASNHNQAIAGTTKNLVDFRTTDDKGSDGQLISLSTAYQVQPNQVVIPDSNGGNKVINNNSVTNRLNKATIGLFQIDQNYYNYQSSLRKQRQNNNPFAEPVLLFTNINGGFGCFGAYNATWQALQLK